jgi:hypothetical protein
MASWSLFGRWTMTEPDDQREKEPNPKPFRLEEARRVVEE